MQLLVRALVQIRVPKLMEWSAPRSRRAVPLIQRGLGRKMALAGEFANIVHPIESGRLLVRQAGTVYVHYETKHR